MTLSIEAIRYLGLNVLVIRSWNGYEKPQKTPLFKITEEELDFQGGRFKLFIWDALREHSQKFALAEEHCKLENVINWIGENIEGSWYFDISDNFSDCYIDGEYFWHAWIFYFNNDEDCVMFTLRWM